MTPEAHNIQFSRQIWQTVSDYAHHCLMRREFCPDQSRVENLRCVDFVEETDSHYGKQIWFFEAIGVDPTGRRRIFHGALEFSLQYGLFEAAQSVMFEDEDVRDRFLAQNFVESTSIFPQKMSRKFWVGTLTALLCVLAVVWVFAFVSIYRS